MREFHKERIVVAQEIWSMILKGEVKTRGELLTQLYKLYNRYGIAPLRGKAGGAQLYDKEAITVYVIGKYGLGLVEEVPQTTLRTIFDKEVLYDKLYEKFKESGDVPKEVLSLDDDDMFRFLRYAFTATVLGFEPEATFISLMQKMYRFEQLRTKVRRYARFYVAFRVAEDIARGKIRSAFAKELTKASYAAKLGIDKAMPDDLQIFVIASKVFGVPEERLHRILRTVAKKVKESESARGVTS